MHHPCIKVCVGSFYDMDVSCIYSNILSQLGIASGSVLIVAKALSTWCFGFLSVHLIWTPWNPSIRNEHTVKSNNPVWLENALDPGPHPGHPGSFCWTIIKWMCSMMCNCVKSKPSAKTTCFDHFLRVPWTWTQRNQTIQNQHIVTSHNPILPGSAFARKWWPGEHLLFEYKTNAF